MKRKMVALLALCAVAFTGCGTVTQRDTGAQPAEEQGAVTEAAEVSEKAEETTTTTVTTTTAAAETVSPSEEGDNSIDPGDEAIKDAFRAFFGYKTNAEKQQEQYWETYTVTTTDFQEYLDELKESYVLTVDGTGLVTRTGELNDDLTWVIKFNGTTMLERNASGELTYRPMYYGDGTYEVYLETYSYMGYVPVSNTVTFNLAECYIEDEPDAANLPEGFERDRVFTKKSHMKSQVQTIYMDDGYVSYKMGFVIDADHNGYPNGVCYYAGLSDNGERMQYLHDNDTGGMNFLSVGENDTVGVWFDEDNGIDYLVFIGEDGVARDCTTEKVIKNFDPSKNFYTFEDSDVSDRDSFIVSYSGTPHREGA